MNAPPQTLSQLQQRVDAIAGKTLGQLAGELGFKTPQDLLREKGWVGQLIELALGASAGSLPEPDFVSLGVELKTLPISQKGLPLETTFVSVAPLTNLQGLTFEQSTVYKKLNHVLWLPILAERDIAVIDRVIGSGFLWRPNEQQFAQLKRDWEELTELIALGKIETLNGHYGEVLQLRPKAANSQALTDAIGPQGKTIQTLPRGFYLKTHFTRQILANHFGL
ncbi:DNA mismatch repair endonuclease MutH [Pseudoalteromonas ruthenica]|uniref:DNA mismatch repair protein MutH n=1 Tax=Pseudoalteromonas ruthenica TaxID=151081 RepID=A0A5S3Z6P6_9GAMM|nr:DNA mismatch repair endonuclease MutH [Pseudoalteromonas ruthenica]TMP87873.1 DNA mismatch repair endonuclease MutH [Pseudoalteromonas ruthenica]